MIKPNYTVLYSLFFVFIGMLIGRACQLGPTTFIKTEVVYIPCDSSRFLTDIFERDMIIDSLMDREPEVKVITKVVHDTTYLPPEKLWDWGDWKIENEKWGWEWSPGEYEQTYTYKDKWADISIEWPKVKYSVIDSLSFKLTKQKRSDILTVESHNPNTIINYLQHEIPYKAIGFGFQTGVMFDGKVRPYVGLGFSWDVVRF